ncbi:hypothetical protein Tco_1176888 [Tanacetum coccineum]
MGGGEKRCEALTEEECVRTTEDERERECCRSRREEGDEMEYMNADDIVGGDEFEFRRDDPDERVCEGTASFARRKTLSAERVLWIDVECPFFTLSVMSVVLGVEMSIWDSFGCELNSACSVAAGVSLVIEGEERESERGRRGVWGGRRGRGGGVMREGVGIGRGGEKKEREGGRERERRRIFEGLDERRRDEDLLRIRYERQELRGDVIVDPEI